MPATRRPPGRVRTPVPEALDGRIFTYLEGRSVGVSADRLLGPSYVKLHRSVYADRHTAFDSDATFRAWMPALPADAALYGRTAAAWYGLPIDQSADFQIIVPPGTVPRRREGLEPHEGLGPDDAMVHRGLRVTTPGRTWLDLSLTVSNVELVVAGDAMVRRGLTTPEDLIEISDTTHRRRQILRARKLSRLVRAGVDSPQETRLRLTLISAGLPCPAVNVDVFDEFGGWIGRPDLAYIVLKIALQYEGDVHRTNKKRWRADIARDEVMREHGWDVIRVTADDLRQPGWLRQRVQRAVDRQRRLLAPIA